LRGCPHCATGATSPTESGLATTSGCSVNAAVSSSNVDTIVIMGSTAEILHMQFAQDDSKNAAIRCHDRSFMNALRHTDPPAAVQAQSFT
jgi:hypothetical protein